MLTIRNIAALAAVLGSIEAAYAQCEFIVGGKNDDMG
jgi:hypothetical protein